MNKWLELLVGLILVVAPIWAAITPAWGAAALSVIMGGIIVGIALIGLLFIMLGISDLKE